jgi:hypothetical protein
MNQSVRCHVYCSYFKLFVVVLISKNHLKKIMGDDDDTFVLLTLLV